MIFRSQTRLSQSPRLSGWMKRVFRVVRRTPSPLFGLPIFLLFAFCPFVISAQVNQGSAYAHAETLIRNHQWDEGIAELQPLLKESPQNLKLLNLIGLAYTGKADRQRANEYFEAALRVSPTFTPALKNLAINEAALGKTEAERRHLESALREVPNDPVVNLYLGELCYRQGDFKHAADYLTHAQPLVSRDANLLATLAVSDLKSNNQAASIETLDSLTPSALAPDSQLALGIALAEAGHSTQAIPYLEAVRNTNTSAFDASYDLAICYVSAKRFQDAIEVLESLSSSGHETSESDNLLAEAYEADHQTQKAVDALRRAIALNPQDDENYLQFASICINHEDYLNAEKVLSVGLGLHPRSAQLLFERGILNAMQDHFAQAEKDFEDSARLAPENNSGYIGLGVTFLETGNAAKAIPILRSRLKEKPNDASLCYLLGEAELQSGARQGDPAYTEAQTYLEKAIQIDPRLVEPHISLGTIYLDQGRLQDAVAELEQARRIDPKAKSAYSHLAIAYRRLGEKDKLKEILVELKDMNDFERTGSRQPVKSEQSAPAINAQNSSKQPDRE